MVEAETCIEYSRQQLDELLNKFKALKDLSEYKLEFTRLLYRILTYNQDISRLKNQIAVTQNKEEQSRLKKKLIKIQFNLQDDIVEYNHLIENTGKNEKVKTS